MACAWVLDWLEVIWTPSAWTVGWFEIGTLRTSQLPQIYNGCPPESRSFRLFYGTDYPSLKLNTWPRFTHPFDIDLMCLHSAELNVLAVTENVNTFLLVWTHVSCYSVNWLYCCQVYKVLTVVMYSSQISNYQLLFLYLTLFIYHWFFTLNPKELCDRIGWGIRSQLFYSYWVYGFSYQAAQVNSLAWVTLFRNICIPFFSYDVELCMLFGRQ